MNYNKIWLDKYTLPLKFIIYNINWAVVVWAVQQFSSDQIAQNTSAPFMIYIYYNFKRFCVFIYTYVVL